jgi:hypothetical protein
MLDHRRVTRAPGWSPQPPAGFRPPGRNLPLDDRGASSSVSPACRLRGFAGDSSSVSSGGRAPRPPAGGASPPGPPVVGVGFWGSVGRLLARPSALHPSLLITFTPHPSPPSPSNPSRPSPFCLPSFATSPPSPFAAFALRRLRSSPLRPPTFTLSDLLASVLRHLRRPFHLSAPFGRTRSPAPRPSRLTPSPFDPSRPFDLLPSVLRHLRRPFAVLRPFTFRRSSAAPLRPHFALRAFAPHPFALRRIRPLTFTPFDPSRPSAFCLPSFDTFAALCPFAFRRSLAASLRLRLALRVFAPHTFALQTSHPSPLRGLGLGLG